MPTRYTSSALRSLPVAYHTASLKGIEAEIYYSLHDLVVEGQLKSGTKLQEDVLCDVFGVSRTVVRKVLVIMEQEGIVTLPPNRGAFIHTPTTKEAKDILETARMITIHTARTLASGAVNFTEADVGRIEEHIALQNKSESELDHVKSRLLSGEFHLLLVHLCGNKVLATMLENMATRLYIVGLMFQRPGPYEPRTGFQQSLLDALKAGDAGEAERVMAGYWDSVDRHLQLDDDKRDQDLRSLLAAWRARSSDQDKSS